MGHWGKKKGNKKFLEPNEDENTTYQNSTGSAKRTVCSYECLN
jgi:hypothetical protein